MYYELYTSQNPDMEGINKFLKGCSLPKLKDGHKSILEKEFTMEALLEIIKKFKTNKSPGPDGYTAEYYK